LNKVDMVAGQKKGIAVEKMVVVERKNCGGK